MAYSYAEDASGKPVRKLHPAVHNLIFIRKTMKQEEMQTILRECPYSVSLYTKRDGRREPYVIHDRDILELRLICDQSFSEPQFIVNKDDDLDIGRKVTVTHGPLKGVHGQLIRKKKKYYVMKTYAGLGVIVEVSRWCCQPDAPTP